MVYESLGCEATKEPANDTMFKMEVDNVVGHHSRVFEDDGPDGGFPAPLPQWFSARTEGAEGVHRLDPSGVGSLV
jgi:hypothetical protein